MMLGILVLVSLLLGCDGCPGPALDTVDFLAYFPTQPGTVMTFRSTNLRVNVTGTTTITLEPKEDWCGIPVIPWHFTKSDLELYWGPGLNWDLRWMIVDPTYQDALVPSFNQYVWVAGDIRVDRDSQQVAQTVLYRSGHLIPAYLLGKKSWANTVIRHNIQDYIVQQGEEPLCPEPHTRPGETPANAIGQWTVTLLTDMAVIVGQDNDLPYSGPVVVADYLEIGGPTLDSPQSWIREQWTFGQGVGLLKILSRYWKERAPTRDELTEPVLSDPDMILVRQRRP